jgi:hypothetical protein
MSETEKLLALRAKIRADIGRYGESSVSRADWLALCSYDLVSLGALAAIEQWNYELVGFSTMRFTDARNA